MPKPEAPRRLMPADDTTGHVTTPGGNRFVVGDERNCESLHGRLEVRWHNFGPRGLIGQAVIHRCPRSLTTVEWQERFTAAEDEAPEKLPPQSSGGVTGGA